MSHTWKIPCLTVVCSHGQALKLISPKQINIKYRYFNIPLAHQVVVVGILQPQDRLTLRLSFQLIIADQSSQVLLFVYLEEAFGYSRIHIEFHQV